MYDGRRSANVVTVSDACPKLCDVEPRAHDPSTRVARHDERERRSLAPRLRDGHERHGPRSVLRARLQANDRRRETTEERLLAARRKPEGPLGAIRGEPFADERAVPRDVLLIVPGDGQRDGS